MIQKKYDLMVLDKDDFPVIAARVTGINRFTDEQRVYYFQQAQGWAEYVLVVSRSQIELWNSYTEESVATFDTATALEPYSKGWASIEKLSRDGLEGFTLCWLDQVIFSINDDVPYKAKLKQLGIVEKLKYGIVRRRPEE
jgi:hypothetical protein